MPNFKDYSIKVKLILVFIVFKVLPLVLLFIISYSGFLEIDRLLQKKSELIAKESERAIRNTTDLTIRDSIEALDRKSQESLEYKTYKIAQQVADFLKNRDEDILFLAQQPHIDERTLQKFYNSKKRAVYVPAEYYYDDKSNKWLPKHPHSKTRHDEKAEIGENAKEFHKAEPIKMNTQIIPIYKEITFYDKEGKEIYKISTIDRKLKDISDKNNTYCKAEEYYTKSLGLRKGEIYVSKVIGAYVPSPIIGTFTKKKCKKAGIKFEPQKYGYAGAENPAGKKFEGIVRFVTPVYQHGKLEGYLTLALDHHHLMDFTDYVDPLSVRPLDIPDAGKGNYAFMWDSDFQSISHPRDYFIAGYDPKTGKKVPGWIDRSLEEKFEKSGEKNLNMFLKRQPWFLDQSLDKKPNILQLKAGRIPLDCRYLNFAP